VAQAVPAPLICTKILSSIHEGTHWDVEDPCHRVILKWEHKTNYRHQQARQHLAIQ
jgi:hypothetical protein